MRYLLIALTLCLSACVTRDTTDREKTAEQQVATAQQAADKAIERETKARAAAEMAKEMKIAQAASNLGPLAAAVDTKGQPLLAEGIEAQKDAIDDALDLPAAAYPKPVADLKLLIDNTKLALANYKTKAAELQGKLEVANQEKQRWVDEATQARADEKAAKREAEEARKVADREATAARWWKIGGSVLASLPVLLSIAGRLGLPGAGILSLLADVAMPLLKQRRDAAMTAVAASDVGRSALSVLDTAVSQSPELANQLTATLNKVTGGRADTVEALFKLAAKSYVVDNAGKMVGPVDALLNHVRGEVLDTAGGQPTALDRVIKPS